MRSLSTTENEQYKHSEISKISRYFLALWIFLAALAQTGCASGDRSSSSVEHPQNYSNPEVTFHAELSASDVVDGSLLLVNIKAPSDYKEEMISVEFEEIVIPAYSTPEKGDGQFQAIVGVPHSHKPGPATVTVKFGYPGLQRVAQLGFTVSPSDYSIENLRVDGTFVNPGKKAMKRIKREQKELKAVYERMTKKRYWSGPFVLPIDSPITSPYGGKRMYNGEIRNFHSGLDLKAPVGTPIIAPSAGVVVLAKDLYFTGGTVILDHGYGVFTIYAHMSKIGVKKGRTVKVREILGLAGATGRVSGPHLHWTTQVNRVKVNPVEFMKVVQ